MKMKILILSLLVSLSVSGQPEFKKPIHPDNGDSNLVYSSNFEWYYDSSYSKYQIRVEYDAIQFLEWVMNNYEYAGYMVEGHRDNKILTTELLWKLKGTKLKGWDVGLTTKEVWLKWYKQVNKL